MSDWLLYNETTDGEPIVGKYKEKLVEVQRTLEKNRPDMFISLLKAIFAALAVFTFLSGFVFTVIPLARNVYNHVMTHIVQPINLWIAEEPVFGMHMIFVFQAAATIMFLWSIRNYIKLFYFYVLSLFEKKPPAPKKTAAQPTKKAGPKSKPTTNNAGAK